MHPGLCSCIPRIDMKPPVHHFHSNPPHHGTRYYLALAGILLVVGAVYVLASALATRF
ncbi:hypothetical protein LMG31506_02635 [Cupriavidus yeoncheonensis]|uniref:Uncharacterized protein n=1 Tax=Cupriavidus yeoncheonensis TaxID=1462994 RepID=A0A916NDT1_9BURK|nr:hypothetical protein LMG31506_02635 [Cupriavidus yeoncheonensis]